MRIEFIEIANFRKLRSTRVGFSKEKTVFVGANNSGKTSAMVALRYFLVERERSSFSLNDFTLSHWPKINSMGDHWEKAKRADEPLPAPSWDDVLPSLDVWLNVEDSELHYVQKILPSLDWEGGLLGVRLRFEPKDALDLQKEYLVARADAEFMLVAGTEMAEKNKAEGGAGEVFTVSLWPQNLTEFLQRRLRSFFSVKAYVLDPDKCKNPEYGLAQSQVLPEGSEPVQVDPFKGLIRIDEISAQRGFGQANNAKNEESDSDVAAASGTRKLSEQLRRYYHSHLDPYVNSDSEDLLALKAIEDAQKAFDGRLKEGFAVALKEMEKLGYPGVTDPRLNISTRLRPVDGLNHDAAVQYVIRVMDGESALDLHLPEDSNGLGYQNLISMVFRLMSFRDAWMRVGKAQAKITTSSEAFVPPLHLVLIEEPEAHLHTQVQQVFIRQAYKILRAHDELKDGSRLATQMVVSTHSSHIAHECDFGSLRYFRRMPANGGDIPTSCVINLTDVFGKDTDTQRFVTRYLKVTHCDLFFADGAVLIEGPAERILVPHFVRYQEEFSDLSECYITWLEIGGSHAHRMKELIESLGLTTLIITDLDAVDSDGKTTTPKRESKQKSRNETLKSWCPATEILDELIDKPESEKSKTYQDEQFSVRAAYQYPITVMFKGVSSEALANTLEDALVFQNIDLFASLKGKGLLAKIRTALEESTTISEVGEKLFSSLKGGGKAELALDLLEIEDPKALRPPAYIREGLLWLASQLRQHHNELGLAASGIPVKGEYKEVA